MKQPTLNNTIKALAALTAALCPRLNAFAQEKVAINGNDVGTWFSNNWMWVTGIVIFLLLVIFFSGGGSRRRRTTTVVKDNMGDVKKITTTEVED